MYIEYLLGEVVDVIKAIHNKSGGIAFNAVTGPYPIITTIQANTTEAIAKTVLTEMSQRYTHKKAMNYREQ